MDSDHHFHTSNINNGTSCGELFICFTSGFSSSSMKISSKCILSPGRAREPSQASLSCRLKSSGSVKGGGQASPMFPAGGKKRGSGFENPEPSSPKVTCIGQVRVKTKKQGRKMMRGRSVKQRSFRKSANLVRQSSSGGHGFQSSHRNQRWVHLPFTICEAVRAFGAELNCFLTCNSPCSSSKELKPPAERSSERSGGRWLVAVQDDDDDGEIEKENGSRRRHVFEGMDFKGENEEESRISICIPPKNALLLMRCRSDPVKMEELAKRFCESPASKLEEEEEDNEVESAVEPNVKLRTEEELSEESVSYAIDEKEETNFNLQEEPIEMATENEIELQKLGITEEEENRIQQQKLTEETMEITIPIETRIESEMAEDAEKLKSVEEDPKTEEIENQIKELEEHENGENPTSPSLPETAVDGNWEEVIEPSIQNDDEMGPEEDRSKERETPPEPERETRPEASVLPECLVLMMYEPKLSMEVSKETWVCSTDFVRCVPTREKKAPPPPPPKKKKPANNIAVQPGRWSCSLPAAAATAMIEQKVARGKGGYEPFVLTRCKSEPVRPAANLAPDGKLEPHRPAAFGVGAAGVGF